LRLRHHRLDRASGHDVVLLDQDAVKQPHALIVATAHRYRIFECMTQARQGFAGIHNPGARAFGGIDKGFGLARHRRQGLQKFSALRSAVSKARAGPLISHNNWLGSTSSPSFASQKISTDGSTCRKHSLNHKVPHNTAAWREITVAVPRWPAVISCAVRSPSPTSSASAVATLAEMISLRFMLLRSKRVNCADYTHCMQQECCVCGY
jgi:hypothetical protein